MKIEMPDWFDIIDSNPNCTIKSSLSKWFNENVEPVNKMFSEGVVLYSQTHSGHGKTWNSACIMDDTHKALLINIEPLKKETCEDMVRKLVNNYGVINITQWVIDAKKVLGESDGN